jgi:hypothetical protein
LNRRGFTLSLENCMRDVFKERLREDTKRSGRRRRVRKVCA